MNSKKFSGDEGTKWSSNGVLNWKFNLEFRLGGWIFQLTTNLTHISKCTVILVGLHELAL